MAEKMPQVKKLEELMKLADTYKQNGADGLKDALVDTIGDILGDLDIGSIAEELGLGDLTIETFMKTVLTGAQADGCGGRSNKKCGVGKVKVRTTVEPVDSEATDNPLMESDQENRDKAKSILDKLAEIAKAAQEKGLLPEEIQIENLEDEGKSVIDQVFSLVPNLAKDLLGEIGVSPEDADSIVPGLGDVLDFFGVK